MANNWFPVIDYEKCVGCFACANFCPHGVFSTDGDKPEVVNPLACVEFCRGCQKICPQDAISYYGDGQK
ncbi:4Fe-4S binding protein [bacterium]|nr:4Fe-4S binding protein [bacterium]